MKKYILILGAGLMQKPAIEACKELGYESLVVDANENALCVPLASRFEKIDLKDREKIAQLALSIKDNLAAVFTAGTDFSSTVSYVAQKCSLPCHDLKGSTNACNKILMRQCFKKENVPSPNFIQVTEENVQNFNLNNFPQLSFPVVVKPVDNMGGRGCRLARNDDELNIALKDAVAFSRTKTAILEDYMNGNEYSIDSILYNGKLYITGFADRHIYFPPYFIETGHTMSTVADEKTKLELISCFARGIKSLGLTCGACKADIKYTEKGAMIGEIAGRLSGGYMSGWTYPYSSDINLTKQALLVALGKNPEELEKKGIKLNVENCPFEVFDCSGKNTSAERAWISIPGTVEKIYGMNDALKTDFVKQVFPRSSEGDTVVFPRNNVEKCGNVISQSSNYEKAVFASESAVAKIVLRLKSCNPETDSFLNNIELKGEKGFPHSAYILSEQQKNVVDAETAQNYTVKTPLSLNFPEKILSSFGELKDFNHRTLKQTLELFDSIENTSGEYKIGDLCRVLVRGGIQGLLYYADSQRG